MAAATSDLLAPLGRPRLMGIVNVTPDSFSDGGRWADAEAAIAHGRELLTDGADLVDIGGESTRPGATRPLLAEELDRVVPVIAALAAEGACVSVDTMRAEVADAACRAGAQVVNDVSGGLADPEILPVVASYGVTYVAMHWRAHSDRMQQHAVYDGPGGVVAAVRSELADRLADAADAGIDPERVVLDPGLGFAKTAAQNWQLLRELHEIAGLGRPLLVGASRKSFLGSRLDDGAGARPVYDRDHSNVAVTTLLASTGVWGLRVHDVRASMDALRVVARMRPGQE